MKKGLLKSIFLIGIILFIIPVLSCYLDTIFPPGKGDLELTLKPDLGMKTVGTFDISVKKGKKEVAQKETSNDIVTFTSLPEGTLEVSIIVMDGTGTTIGSVTVEVIIIQGEKVRIEIDITVQPPDEPVYYTLTVSRDIEGCDTGSPFVYVEPDKEFYLAGEEITVTALPGYNCPPGRHSCSSPSWKNKSTGMTLSGNGVYTFNITADTYLEVCYDCNGPAGYFELCK